MASGEGGRSLMHLTFRIFFQAEYSSVFGPSISNSKFLFSFTTVETCEVPRPSIYSAPACLSVHPIISSSVGLQLAAYLDDDDTLLVISTDLCRFGQRYGFTDVDAGGFADLVCAIAEVRS